MQKEEQTKHITNAIYKERSNKNWLKFFNRNRNTKVRQTETGTRTETGTEKRIYFHECEGLQILCHPISCESLLINLL